MPQELRRARSPSYPHATRARPALILHALATGVLTLTAVAGAGCGSTRTSGPSSRGPVGPAAQAPLALIDQTRVDERVLHELLRESAGGRALEEIALDRAIAERLADDGLELTPADLEAERTRLLDVLAREIGLTPDASVEVEERVRAARGLGPERWAMLLRRAAGLRKLVAGEVDVGDAALRLAHAENTAPRAVARVIEVPTRRDASAIASRVASAPDPASAFLAAAVDESNSPSRGRLLVIAQNDPIIPEAIRRVTASLEPGEISSVVATRRGFAIVRLERRTPGTPQSFDDARPELERAVRLRQESVLMDRLARRLLDGAAVSVFDPALSWSWDNTR